MQPFNKQTRVCFRSFLQGLPQRITLNRLRPANLSDLEKHMSFDPDRYQPLPIDTSAVSLDGGLLLLEEMLARNAHDVWAKQRMASGWKYGPQRDDLRKEHPCLIPYEQLPESEKEYDQSMALETLKVILALGYKIEKIS